MDVNYKILNVPLVKPAETDQIYTSDIDKPVRLRLHASPPHSQEFEPLTIHELFARSVRKAPKLAALVCKRDGVERRWNFQEYYDAVVSTAKAFLALGLGRFRSVCILGFNAPEWVFANLGAIFAGGVGVGIYATNSVEACSYIIEHSGAQVIVVENENQLNKVAQLPLAKLGLLAIVQYTGTMKKELLANATDASTTKLLNWSELIELGRDVPDSAVEERLREQAPNNCASLIYTSGTTGNPKAAMISHDNVTWVARVSMKVVGVNFGEHRSVTFLPLSHIAAQIADIYCPICIGICMHFARPDALKGTLGDTLLEVRPTYMFAVPRVWEKMQDKISKAVSESGTLKQWLLHWAQGVGLSSGYEKMRGGKSGLTFKLADKLVYSKLREKLGLDQGAYFFTAAAPISKDTLEFFLSLNILILEVFGMTESTGPHTISVPNAFRILSAGKDMPGTRTVIRNPDQDGEGELLLDGRNIFMGYLKDADQTKEAIDSEGFLHTGDLAKKDSDGFFYITGRIKELVITAGGENIAPRPIEERMRAALPKLLSNIMVVGDRRKFLAVLLTLKVEINMDTLAPTSKLIDDTRAYLAHDFGAHVDTVDQVIEALYGATNGAASSDLSEFGKRLHAALKKALDKVNEGAVSSAAKIQKYLVLPRDFSIAGGELGPTLKLRRSFVAKLYKAEIDQLYAESDSNGF